MEAQSELTIKYQQAGRNGKLLLIAYLDNTPIHTDKLDIADSRARRRFLKALCKDRPGIDEQSVGEELERIAASSSADNKPANTTTFSADSPPYQVTDHGLVWLKPTHDGDVPTSLTNFTAQIVTDLMYDDGVESRHSFEIEAKLNGRVSRFSVPASRFSGMTWACDHLGAQAIIYPGFTVTQHARTAIQMLSGKIAIRTIYTHTGWRKVNDEWVYLHADGAIGPQGCISGVEVSLPDGLKFYALPAPPNGEDLVAAIRTSLRILDLAPAPVTWPLFCMPWRAVLGSCAFSVHLAGHTGTGKSALAALVQQHFGLEMLAKHLPASWSSTANALEGLAFNAKDAVMTVDDFAPGGTQYDVQRFHREAARLFRAQGNLSGRQRMMQDTTLRPSKPPRGLILSTGEDVPKGQSVRARMMIVEMGPEDMDWEALTICQSDAASGLYTQAMAAFIRWLAPQREDLDQLLKKQVTDLRQCATRSNQHKRTPEILAEIAVGLRYFLIFAKEVGAITTERAEALWDNGWTALGEAAEAQAGHQAASDPVQRFLELLSSAVVSGNAHVAGPRGGEPDRPETWGWRLKTIGTGSYQREEWQPQGDRIGWVDGGDLYLDPGASYRAAQQMAGTGGGIPITDRTLHKRLDERGLLASREAKRKKLTVRRVLDGSRRTVLHLRTKTLLGEEPAQQAQSSLNSPQDGENNDSGAGLWAGTPDAAEEQAHETSPTSRENLTDGAVGPVGPLPGSYDSDAAADAANEWEERAAIMEFDGNLPREQAEACAKAQTFGSGTDTVTVTGNEMERKRDNDA